MNTYTYKANIYGNLYDLSEALGKDGIFIPLSISDDTLQELSVVVIHAEEPIEILRERKIMELKRLRDSKEVEPIEYKGYSFDYDEKARDRINAAIIALSLQGEGATIEWTTADNSDTPVTANDLKMLIAAVAVRSNKLHTAYRVAKEKVEAATTAAEVETVTMEV
ncbi:DUF4376 domain-containing protein [Phascolarctobacterium succinatutens]|uniref:DUF4376 domain-containing protein n=1 Tax=Phascolarctobacterium succinatutens TaxID=626940 RepID=UPI00307A4E1B